MPSYDPNHSTARQIVRGITNGLAQMYDGFVFGNRVEFFHPRHGQVELMVTARRGISLHIKHGDSCFLEVGTLTLEQIIDKAINTAQNMLSPEPEWHEAIPVAPAHDQDPQDYLSGLPAHRDPHDARGKVLFLPRTGMTVIFARWNTEDAYCTVLDDPTGKVPPGDLTPVSHLELRTAIERPLAPLPGR
ncbi:hypothetical protein LG293_17285 (plasmid) [Citricoccus nitrophenolicus]